MMDLIIILVKVLDVLAKYNVKATFFVLGSKAKKIKKNIEKRI